MGDTHFLLRNAIVGVVVILFVWLGWWSQDPVAAVHFILRQKPEVASAIFSAVFTAPVIGISIQGLHIFLMWLVGRFFRDDARRIVADSMRSHFRRCAKVDEPHWQALEHAPSDSLFVWLYHRSAPNDLIEWARRRRSYYYLGINLVIAALVGSGAGARLPYFLAAPPDQQWRIVFAISLVWGAGAIWAAFRMLRDVDTMELLWAAARMNPQLRECLEQSFGTLVHETYSGNDPVARNRQQEAPAQTAAAGAAPAAEPGPT